jgi:cytochrome oxidase Cu insertion factor (SCO1/SenC/PrrC family)
MTDRLGFWLRLLALAALALVAVFAGRLPWQQDPAETSKPLPAVGDPAPDFLLQAADGSEVTSKGITAARPALFYFSMGPG